MIGVQGEVFADKIEGLGNMTLHGSVAQLEPVGDFFISESIVSAKQENLFACGRQQFDRFLYRTFHLLLFAEVEGRQRLGFGNIGVLFREGERDFFPEIVDDMIPGHGKEPCFRLFDPAELHPFIPQFHEYILYDILGLLG